MRIAFAPLVVAERSTCSGDSPACVMYSISRKTEGPCSVPMFPASVPIATGIPASHTFRRLASEMASAPVRGGLAINLRMRSGMASAGILARSPMLARICGSPRRCSAGVGFQVPDRAYL